MLNKSHPLSRYKSNGGKNKIKKKTKKNCLIHFELDARVFVFSNWHKIKLCDRFHLVIFIFIHNFDEEMCFPDKCCYENWQTDAGHSLANILDTIFS